MVVKTDANSLDLVDQFVKRLVFLGTLPVVGPLELILHLLGALVIDRRVPLLQGLCQFEPSLGDRLHLFASDDFLILRIGCIGIDRGGKLDNLVFPRSHRLRH